MRTKTHISTLTLDISQFTDKKQEQFLQHILLFPSKRILLDVKYET